MGYHMHWPLRDILDLDHGERRRWAEEIANINRRINEGSS